MEICVKCEARPIRELPFNLLRIHPTVLGKFYRNKIYTIGNLFENEKGFEILKRITRPELRNVLDVLESVRLISTHDERYGDVIWGFNLPNPQELQDALNEIRDIVLNNGSLDRIKYSLPCRYSL